MKASEKAAAGKPVERRVLPYQDQVEKLNDAFSYAFGFGSMAVFQTIAREHPHIVGSPELAVAVGNLDRSDIKRYHDDAVRRTSDLDGRLSFALDDDPDETLSSKEEYLAGKFLEGMRTQRILSRRLWLSFLRNCRLDASEVSGVSQTGGRSPLQSFASC